MEDKKQELLKLIDNLVWDGLDGLNDRIDYFLIKETLEKYQKEKTIEQKLEELGFNHTNDQNTKTGLYYSLWAGGEIINMEFVVNEKELRIGDLIPKYMLFISCDKTKEILDFANYLVSLKNGVTE